MKKRNYPKIVLYVFLAIVVIGFFTNTLRRGMNDFNVVHRAATRILHKENLYNFQDGHYLYKYSPFFALLVAPIGLLPRSVAGFLWLLGMCVCLFFVIKMAKKMIIGDKPPPAYFYLLSLLLASKFLVREITLGQTDFLILLLIFLCLHFVQHEKEFLAGIFFALSALIKPTSLIFIPYFLYKKRFKATVSAITMSLVFLLFPSFVYGFWGNMNLLSGWKKIMSVSSPPLLAVDMNQSIFAFFYRLFTSAPYEVNILNLNYTVVNALIYATIVGFFLFLLFLNKKSKVTQESFVHNKESVEYSFLFIFMALFSPLGWFQNYSSSILAIMILVYYVLVTKLSKIPPIGLIPQGRRPKAGKDKFILIMLVLFFILVDAINFETVGRRLNDLSLYLSFITWGIFILMASLSKLRLSKIA
jgi:Gpi18-like mannosyltransferase